MQRVNISIFPLISVVLSVLVIMHMVLRVSVKITFRVDLTW